MYVHVYLYTNVSYFSIINMYKMRNINLTADCQDPIRIPYQCFCALNVSALRNIYFQDLLTPPLKICFLK